MRAFRFVQFDRLFIGISLFVFISPRLAAIPLLFLFALQPARFSKVCARIIGVALVLAFASPVDIGVPGVFAHYGNKPGVRLVHVHSGMPMITKILQREGEFISLGCGEFPCIYPPVYWLVWWQDQE